MKTLLTRIFIVLTLLIFILPRNSFAQNQITGTVFDEKGAPLAYANVLLLQPSDSLLVAGNIADGAGKYTLENIPTGNYLLRSSMIGFEDQYSDEFSITKSTGIFSAPDLRLKENSAQLEEVNVVAKRALFEQKIDRMVVNVDNSITNAGSNALEVLKRSPGIMVNPQTNSIAMSGKDGVVIMINGKISRMPMDAIIQMLAGMNSESVEKIELIHTPPANFDAEGNAGFINIVLKKNQGDGFNGNFSLNAGYGKREKAGATLDFNLRRNKLNFFGGYSWNYNYNPQVFGNYRKFIFEGNTIENIGESDRDPTRTHVQNARLGLDIQMTDKTVLGGLVSWGDRNWEMDAINDVQILQNGIQQSRLLIPNDEVNHSYNFLGNVNVQHQFTKDSKLNFDIDYAYFYNDNPSNYVNQYFDEGNNLVDETQLRVQKNTPIDILVGKLDYTQNFGENIIWELGAKATATAFDNDILVEDFIQDEWVVAPLFSSKAKMEESIAAAYSAVTWKFNKKTDVKAGLRFEYTDSNLGTEEEPDIVDRQYGRLFPSLFISNKINDKNTIQFSYSRRIQRPSFRQLAPFFIFFDPNTVGTGNPALQPATSDAVKLTYIFKTIQLGLNYSYTRDAIGRFQPDVDLETNTQVNGAKNFNNAQNASATISFPITINKWWEARTSWSAQWQEYNDEVEGQQLSFSASSWYMNGSSTFTLPNKFTAEISGFYYGPALFGVVLWQDFYSLDIGIQKELNNNNGTLRFSVNDLFVSTNWTGRLDDPEINFVYEGYYGMAERIFRLTYTKQFGSSKVKGARRRSTGSEEEQRRAN